MDHLYYFCLVLLCFHARLFVDALGSPARKGLTSWLSFMMSEGLDGGIWYSLFIKNLAHYSSH